MENPAQNSDHLNINNAYSKYKDGEEKKNDKQLNKICCCNKCCPTKYQPQCCNWCCCAYILLGIILSTILSFIIIFDAIVPTFKQPQFTAVYWELFNYAVHEDILPVNDPVVFVNGTSQFIVEVYNPLLFTAYVHNWEFQATGYNLQNNLEQWGTALCCGDPHLWTKDHPYNHSEYYLYNQENKVTSKTLSNITAMLFFPYFGGNMLNIAKDALFESKGYIGLRGSGWAKSKLLSTEIKLYLHCDFMINTTVFRILQDKYVQHIGPNCYVYERFPVLEQNCSFWVGGYKLFV